MDYFYVYFYCLAYIAGALMYYIAFYTIEDSVSANGQSNNIWNTGLVIYASFPWIYNLYCLLETKRISFAIIISYVISFMMFMPLCVYLVNSGDNLYSGTQWEMLSNPLFNLTLLLLVSIVLLPRVMWLSLEHSFWHPEFTKIKGD